MRDVRRFVVSAVIGSFSLAALMGIVALLSPGQFGETEVRVLGTTVAVGVESVALLCYLAVVGRGATWLGIVGAAVSLVAFGSALAGIWGVDTEAGGKVMGSSAVVAATFAQAALLVALTWRRRTRLLLVGTLAAAAGVAGLVVVPMVAELEPPGGYFRVLGVLAILDALGSVVLVALAVVARFTASREPERPPVDAVSALVPALDRAVAERLARLAADRGRTPEQLVDEALDALERAEEAAQAS